MAKDVEIGVRITDKGSLKELDKNARSVDRGIKGVAGASSQGLSGGLVPAYAVLAANLFAITAAFRFLKDASDYRIMLQAQEEFAMKTGQNLGLLTKRLQEATDGQLQFAEASQAAAIGRSAGLSRKKFTRRI